MQGHVHIQRDPDVTRTVRAQRTKPPAMLLAAVCLAAIAWTSQARPAAAAYVVNCFDPALGTVQETLAGDCEGAVVSEDEAARIRHERRERVRRILKEPSGLQIVGRRLAGIGSGFFVAANGSLLTNNHVVLDCAVVSISPAAGEMVLARKIAFDPSADLALLQADLSPPAVATFSTRARGRSVMGQASLVGYPNQGLVPLNPVVTAVEVVGRRRTAHNLPIIVLKGNIRTGNSGGPLLDSSGLVIGVVFAKINSVKVFETTGRTVRHQGYALSTDTVLGFLEDQGVDYRTNTAQGPQSRPQILSEARPYIAQVGCWK